MWIFFCPLLKFPTVTQHGNRGWTRNKVLIDINPFITPLSHERVYHTTGVYAPYPLRTAVWVLLHVRPTRISCETEPSVFRPYLWRIECLSICRCHNKGSTFSSVILIPWVLGRPGFEPGTSRSADRPLSNWANRPPVSLTEQSSFSDISSTSKWWPG